MREPTSWLSLSIGVGEMVRQADDIIIDMDVNRFSQALEKQLEKLNPAEVAYFMFNFMQQLPQPISSETREHIADALYRWQSRDSSKWQQVKGLQDGVSV